MQSIEAMLNNETRPEVLREMALLILKNNEILSLRNQELLAKKTLEEKQKQEWINASIKAQLHKLTIRMFGTGREGLNLKSRARRTDADQLLLHAQSLGGKPHEDEKLDLPKEDCMHTSSIDDIFEMALEKDPSLVKESTDIEAVDNFFETSTEITITERTFKKVIHKRQKYRVKNRLTKSETLVTAEGPVKLVAGSRYSVDFALAVVSGKFLNHLPYERQMKEMQRLGIKVPVMTMFRLSEQVALHMGGVAEEIRQDIFESNLACHLDETRWPILNKNSSDGMMWILSNQAGSYYLFDPTRTGAVADELLKGFSGCVLTDKFSGYKHFRDVKNITWGLCWAHARREFLDLHEAYPDVVEKIILKIDQLCEYEREARTWEELKKIRGSKSKLKIAEIKEDLEIIQRDFFDQSELCKAANYVLTGWPEFTAFIGNMALPLTNNDAERALRHAVLGRKNFNGSKTINGADVAATLYSVIESCKKVELDPVDYMKYVITENQKDRKALTPLKFAKQIRGL
jgi:Transposase IS66 family